MNKSHQPEPINYPPYYNSNPNDEIDLRELFVALWKGKWIIIICTIVCTALAIAYALTAKEQWSSTAKIAQPQVSDFSEYQNQIVQFQPIFDIYQEDGTVLVSEALDGLKDAEKLYRLFIDEFNSSSNKRAFLETSKAFQEEKALLDDPEDEDALRILYNTWYKLFSLKADDPKKTEPLSSYSMMVSAETSLQSFDMLNNYIKFIDKKVHQKALNNLSATVSSKKNELKQQSIMLTKQASQRLLVEKERSEYALSIAQAAGVNKPLENFGNEEMFAINLGSDAIKAKVEALSKVKNLSVIEPRLEQLHSKLEQIDLLKVDQSIQFSAVRYLDEPEREVSRDKPKRALIAILGVIFGGMLGIFLVIVRHFWIKEK